MAKHNKKMLLGWFIDYQILIQFFSIRNNETFYKKYKRKQIHIFNGWLLWYIHSKMFQKWLYPRVTWYCYANDLIPFVTMPIRPKTRTLIDNIFSNNYKDNQKQERGIIYDDLSDHFPIYNISKNINKAVILSHIEKKRRSMLAFINIFGSYDWFEKPQWNWCSNCLRLFSHQAHRMLWVVICQ